MRRTLLAVLLLVGTQASAQTGAQAPAKPEPPAPSAPGAWLPRETAELLVLDKISARPTTLTLKVGQAADNASLSIAVRACAVRPQDQAQDAAAFLDIKDSRPGAPGFHGWMFANEPAVNMLEHPVYDVRLIACH